MRCTICVTSDLQINESDVEMVFFNELNFRKKIYTALVDEAVKSRQERQGKGRTVSYSKYIDYLMLQ